MRVLIVAKTRQGSGACIGGITFEGRSVRLIAADAAYNEHAGLEYTVGEVWEVDAAPADHVVPPHVENVIVRARRRLGPMTDPVPFIETHMPPLAGRPEVLYEGLAQTARSGALYIAQRTGIPPYSTVFWRPDRPLHRVDEGKRIRYRYPVSDDGRTLAFVGFQEPIAEIPTNTLVRVSLAHWWRPDGDETAELRCYVQLSGWFLPKGAVPMRSASSAVLHAGCGTTARGNVAQSAGLWPHRQAQSSGLQYSPISKAAAHVSGDTSGDENRNADDADTADNADKLRFHPRPPRSPRPTSWSVPPVERDTTASAGQTAVAVSGQPSAVGAYRPDDESAPPSPSLAGRGPGGRSPAPDLTAARQLLKTIFGYDAFRPLQAEIVANILARRDTLGVMPTGSGKSLCYQLPALLFAGLTVVISPLIALMQDQVTQLHELGVPAVFLNSTLDYQDYVRTANRVRSGEIKLLYTSPETLLRPETLVLLDQASVACLAIDEAHCISQWGHDFRPEYRRLRPVRERYPAAVCVAFTATATARVQEDIKATLGFRAEDTFVASYNRENLFLQVLPRTRGFAQVTAFLQQHPDQSGIIYCSTRKQVDELAEQLTANGWPALPYHAGLDSVDRQRHQDLFARDKAPIIVATIAFGMGINKSNVRYVLHYNLPESLEQYYQEIGRSGRDGLRADCLLLFSRRDLAVRYQLIEEGAPHERPGRHARLQAMLRYAEASDCRRVPLLTYFGEEPAAEACGFCDNCLTAKGSAAQVDATAAARKFLACVGRTGQRFGVMHVVRVLRGSRAAEVRRWRHDQIADYGAGQEHSEAQWRRLAEQFIRQGLLEQDMGHGGLRLTAKGQAALDGAQVFVTPEARRAAAAITPETAYDQALFARLRTLRRELAEAADLPPYVVFSDRSLAEMATYFPQSPQSLLAVHGVGQRKLAQYGEPFLAALRAYCAEHDLAERPRPADAPSLSEPGQRRRFEEVGALFTAGHSVPEIQGMFGVTRGTIVQHLGRCVWAGQRFPPDRLRELSALSEADQARVLAAFVEHGTAQLRPVFEALGEAIPWDELHIMRMVCLCMGEDAPS